MITFSVYVYVIKNNNILLKRLITSSLHDIRKYRGVLKINWL